MSPAAIAYRDATLAKIKRKPSSQDANSSFTTVSMRDRSIDNATLQFRWRGRPQEDLHTWRQLENAWKASTDDKTHTADLNVYKRCVDNLVLTATSNVVLSAFQEVFCQERSRLDADQIREMMLLVRLVDSMALKQGRKVASVIQPH
ncbi:TPA: hypothetical protein N0F65_005768 [Lagenidium giganteum]|uniref:Uncharacterized protein n=1 Tax=Lagenidium giganteum TaxID=4803 RepID=A0AAV2YP75_9STRA|nr:TPA: hypothetical protein N0F65_005768 [Lagenidium giganteum]